MFIPFLKSWLRQQGNCSKCVVTTQHATPFVMMRLTSEFLLMTWNWVSTTLYEAFMIPNIIVTPCSILHVGLWYALIKVHLAVSRNYFKHCTDRKSVLFFSVVQFFFHFGHRFETHFTQLHCIDVPRIWKLCGQEEVVVHFKSRSAHSTTDATQFCGTCGRARFETGGYLSEEGATL